MTWPFENDTSAIVKKLAGRSMQADKRNKAFLLLTIAISVCMVFSILLISTGTQEKFKNTQRNKAQIGILGVTDEQTAQLHQNENITWVGEYSALGVFYVENKTITVEKNGILVAEDIAQVGDTLKIEGRAFDGRTFDVEAVVVGTYNRSDLMEDSPVVPGSPYFIMTYDTAKKLTGITEQTGILAVKNSEGRFDEVLTAVQKIADKNEKIEVNTIEQTIKNIQYRYSASINALYMTYSVSEL